MAEKKIVIIGGGIAGLVTALHLTREGVPCTVVEKKVYPFHRVCGEYISNEAVPYLKWLDAFPSELRPSTLTHFQLTSVFGDSATLPLDLGGFGISRFKFDHFLYQLARSRGVDFLTGTEITECVFKDDRFTLHSDHGPMDASVVIGSFGKRSKLDKYLERSFMTKRSPYMGVKYHIRIKEFPAGLIALHNFQNGYCGISRVEESFINLCYLSHRDNLKAHKNLQTMEEVVVCRNPFLKKVFQEAEFVFEKAEVINEISFETKVPVEGNILMIGDAAGMITPLCGNGMAMAIHSAKILSELLLRHVREPGYNRLQLESDYTSRWNDTFRSRIRTGRIIQGLFGGVLASGLAVSMARFARPVANYLMRKTHGSPF